MRRLNCHSSQLPLTYASALQQQLTTVDSILANSSYPYECHFLEHSHVLTKGRGFVKEHLISAESELLKNGVEVVEVSRGGSVTYHGPGQLVVYVHVHLKELGLYLTHYLRDLEQWVMDALAEFNVDAGRRKGLTGVWVSQGKICAMGIAAKKFVSYHGVGLNVSTNMDGFNWIVPCGLVGQAVTSLDQVLGRKVERIEVEEAMLKHMPQWLALLERV